MIAYLWIGLGSAIGGMARYFLSGLVADQYGHVLPFGPLFPWGTICVNALGSFFIGVLAAISAPEGHWFLNTTARQFFMVGVCGGFTTFSSFSLQTLALAQESQWWLAAANIAISIVVCLIAVSLGYLGMQALNR